jgi:hypothetical protein
MLCYLLTEVYRYLFICTRFLHRYRRLAFMVILPALNAKPNEFSNSKTAGLGVLLSLLSLTVYSEVKPYKEPLTNILAYAAQYLLLLTYGAALAINTELTKKVPEKDLGYMLIVVNFAVIALTLVFSGSRYYIERKRKLAQEASQALRVEWACNFDDVKFNSTLDAVEASFVPPSHCLVYWSVQYKITRLPLS